MIIRLLQPSEDLPAYRALRLLALQESPDAFGSSYEEECAFTPERFEERMRPQDDPGGGVFGAFDEAGTLLGTLGFSREKRRKSAHISYLWGMYVRPELRGQRVGAALLDEALRHARTQTGVRQVTLGVTSHNAGALALYRSRGFQSYGIEPDYLRIAGEFYAMEYMILVLHPEP